MLADYADNEDLINVGAYKQGSNPKIDEAIAKRDEIEKFLAQAVDEKSAVDDTLKALGKITGIEIPEDEMGVYLPKMSLSFVKDEHDEESVSVEPASREFALEETVSQDAEDLPLMDFK